MWKNTVHKDQAIRVSYWKTKNSLIGFYVCPLAADPWRYCVALRTEHAVGLVACSKTCYVTNVSCLVSASVKGTFPLQFL